MATLQSNTDSQILLLCNFAGVEYAAYTRCINGDWLFDKRVDTGVYSSFKV